MCSMWRNNQLICCIVVDIVIQPRRNHKITFGKIKISCIIREKKFNFNKTFAYIHSSKTKMISIDIVDKVVPGIEPGSPEGSNEIKIRSDNHYTTQPIGLIEDSLKLYMS